MNDLNLNVRKYIYKHSLLAKAAVVSCISVICITSIIGGIYAIKPMNSIYRQQEELIYKHDSEILSPAKLALYSESINNNFSNIIDLRDKLVTLLPEEKTAHNLAAEVSILAKAQQLAIGRLEKTATDTINTKDITIKKSVYDLDLFGSEENIEAFLKSAEESKSMFSIDKIAFSNLSGYEKSKYRDANAKKVSLQVSVYFKSE